MCTEKPAFKMVRERTVNTRLQIVAGTRGFSSSGGETITWGKLALQGHALVFGRKESEIFYD